MAFALQDSVLKAAQSPRILSGATNFVLTPPRGIPCSWTVFDFLLDGIKGSILYPEPKRISFLINQIDLSAFFPRELGSTPLP